MVKKEDLENKYIFWDIDGTLAEFRFNDHLASNNSNGHAMTFKEVENGVFLKRKPSLFMQKIVNECNAKEHIIMGHYIWQKELEDKHKWLNIYFPIIERRLFISLNNSKADIIIQFCKENDISLKDVVFVDDSLSILKEAELKGIRCYHISSFLDWNYQNSQI